MATVITDHGEKVIRAANAIRIIQSVETITQFLGISPWVRSLKDRVEDRDWLTICSEMLLAGIRGLDHKWKGEGK